MINIRSGAAAVAVLGAVMSVSAAHAATVAFDDVGFGNLVGNNTPNVLDNNSAVVTAKISETAPGLAVVDSVVETLNGKPFTLSQHGSQLGTGDTYLAGFTFNLTKTTDLAVTNVTSGAKYILVKDFSTDGGKNGTTIPYAASVAGIGTPVASYANLGSGKYTLLFEGIANLTVGTSEKISATISAVPLPGSLVMFGSALIGLTAMGSRRRRAGNVA